MQSGQGIADWLTERADIAEVEAYFTPKPEQLARNPKLPNQPFGGNPKWEELKSSMLAGDELWFYCSPPETWRNLRGRAGLAVVRAGKVVDSFLVQMN